MAAKRKYGSEVCRARCVTAPDSVHKLAGRVAKQLNRDEEDGKWSHSAVYVEGVRQLAKKVLGK